MTKFSIIITTFGVLEYLKECLRSLQNFEDIEILVGIDGCEKTKSAFEGFQHSKKCRFFYFPVNSGTYNVKNNLIKEAKGETILFFDSDDIALSNLLDRWDSNYDIIRLKFQDFGDKINKIEVAQGVFFIKKQILNQLIGFQPWKCNADAEFRMRVEFNNLKVKEDDVISFMRRKHDKNLTTAKNTAMGSKLRKEYENIINNKVKTKNWSNPKIEIREYYEL